MFKNCNLNDDLFHFFSPIVLYTFNRLLAITCGRKIASKSKLINWYGRKQISFISECRACHIYYSSPESTEPLTMLLCWNNEIYHIRNSAVGKNKLYLLNKNSTTCIHTLCNICMSLSACIPINVVCFTIFFYQNNLFYSNDS